METKIGAYKLLGPMDTSGSGTARWCLAEREGKTFFLKQFLSPVFPPERFGKQMEGREERCRLFENRKRRLYTALSRVPGQSCVPVVDFFRCGAHYYAASPALPEEAVPISQWEENRGKALSALARSLRSLHTQGMVHGDVKPEHVYVLPSTGQIRLVDFDSGFFPEDPPLPGEGMDGDPAWIAPETYLRMTGQEEPIDFSADIFSLALVLHREITGKLPESPWEYAYQAVLRGEPLGLDPSIPPYVSQLLTRMLARNGKDRPEDDEIVFALEMEFL